MRLQLCTWTEVREYLAQSKTIIMPIGSTEQHGPNGLIGTDALSAEGIAWAAGEAAGVMVGPTIHVGMAHHHMEFPGSMTLRPSTLMLVIKDYVLSLAEHGFERFLFVNGHGGNVPTINAAFYETYAELRARHGRDPFEIRCKLLNWWEAEGVAPLARELYGSQDGSHATASEVAVCQHLYPDHIKQAVMDPPVAPSSRFYHAHDYRRRFPDGRIGSNPALATPEAGKRLFDVAVAGTAKAVNALAVEF